MTKISNSHVEIDKNFSYLKLVLDRLKINKIISLKRVLSGQVNAVYQVNGKFIIRLSDGKQDGRNFQKESQIITGIAGRVRVPETIFADYSHEQIPLDVIVSKKKTGNTLAQKWPSSSDSQKKNYIKGLCNELKKLHRLPLNDFPFLIQTTSWQIKFQKYIEECFALAEVDNEIDQNCVTTMKEHFVKHRDTLFCTQAQGLIHGDIHFENILVGDKNIQALLDFEYADIAPLDFELAKIINFCLSPQKFIEARLENEYDNINLTRVLGWIKKYYSELFDVDSLVERQRIYLIPDILWGFKLAYISKVHRAGEGGGSETKLKKLDLASKSYRDIYFNQTLEKLLS